MDSSPRLGVHVGVQPHLVGKTNLKQKDSNSKPQRRGFTHYVYNHVLSLCEDALHQNQKWLLHIFNGIYFYI